MLKKLKHPFIDEHIETIKAFPFKKQISYLHTSPEHMMKRLKLYIMAHKKGAGSSNNGRESESKRLGVKIYGGQAAIAGNIIIRQRGTTHHPGVNVGMGKDHTIYSLIDGVVEFKKKANKRSYISVIPFEKEEVVN